MSDTSQIALMRNLYDARGNVNIFKSLLADDVEWDIEEGFPNGGVYRGIGGVFDFFRFVADFDEFYAKGDEYFESGDHVIVLGRYFGVTKKGRKVQSRMAISGQSETARSGACSRPATPFSSHKLWENDWTPRMERVQLNGADIEYEVRGSGAPVVFIHGAILSDGFVPVIEQTGIAENFQIVHYRRRGYAG